MEDQYQQPEKNTSPEDKLDDVFSMEGYDKPVRYARVILFVLAAMQLIGILTVPVMMEPQHTITMAVYIVFTIVFAALGFWTNKKPFSAIITALIIYSLLIIVAAIKQPFSILQGWLVKIIIYVFLIAAIKNARDVQRWKDSQKDK